MPRTRSQAAASGSPLQSLSQQEARKKEERKKRAAAAKAAKAAKEKAEKTTATTSRARRGVNPQALKDHDGEQSAQPVQQPVQPVEQVQQPVEQPVQHEQPEPMQIQQHIQPDQAAQSQQTEQPTRQRRAPQQPVQRDLPAQAPRQRRAVRQRAPPLRSAASPPLKKFEWTAESLLQKVIDARDEGRIKQYGPTGKPADGIAFYPENEENEPPAPAPAIEEPATPPPATPAPAVTSPETPRTTGWGIRSLFSSFVPALFGSPSRPAPASESPAAQPSSTTQQQPQQQSAQQPQSQQPESQQLQPQQQSQPLTLPQEEVEEIGAALSTAPATPTPNRAVRRAKAKADQKSQPRRGKSDQATKIKNTIVKTAIRDVKPQEVELAKAWAEQTAQTLSQDPNVIGTKRKQLAQPMKLKDVKDIPARRPWEAEGSFGLLPEFFDDSDSDEEAEAPGWYLVDQLANEQPAMKKRKTDTTSSPQGSSTSPKRTPPKIINTNGKSALLNDLRPRPATIPSPMFDNPVTHHEGGNVFEEYQTQAMAEDIPVQKTPARDRAAFLKELRRTGHVEGSGSFCVPESDSDDSDEDDTSMADSDSSLPWTQQPPPPPTPAHAKLPAPLDGSPSVPEIQKGRKALDPVESQRARALKHTPAKQSRLREVMVPSPSLKSDGGASPLVYGSSNLFGRTLSFDALPLDFGDEVLLEAASALLGQLDGGKAAGYGGGEVVMRDWEDDEEVSEEGEEL
jgi:hypothetical protein